MSDKARLTRCFFSGQGPQIMDFKLLLYFSSNEHVIEMSQVWLHTVTISSLSLKSMQLLDERCIQLEKMAIEK